MFCKNKQKLFCSSLYMQPTGKWVKWGPGSSVGQGFELQADGYGFDPG